MPMFTAGIILTLAEQIIDLLDKREVRYPEDAYLKAVRTIAGKLVAEARKLQWSAALLTDYDAAHELLRREEA
jgi:hypothetical protein